jgi:hypothetical protein
LRDIGATTQMRIGDLAGCTYPRRRGEANRPEPAQWILENRTAAAARADLPDTRNLT